MKHIAWIIALVFLWLPGPAVAQEAPAVIGRITAVFGGELLRYDTEAREWVQLVEDAPFGLDDALYSEERARAEIFIPNGTLVRLDGNTQILTLALEAQLTHLQLDGGLLRAISRENGAGIEILTRFGRVWVPSGAAADIAVDPRAASVTAVQGSVQVLTESGAAYPLAQGDALQVTEQAVSSIADARSPAWSDWNRTRDGLWAARSADTPSARHLPPGLTPYAHELDAHGEWRLVSYAGSRHWLWRPTRVTPAWAPYTHGRWVTWYGDPCWIPAEPFGYVTHHYGSWEFLNGLWFWVPPGLGVSISLGYGWYPGRVGWVSYGAFIGWYPLLWHEPWYAHRRWGAHSLPHASYRIVRHHHAPRAVVVEHRHFHHGRSYADWRHQQAAPSHFKPHRGPHQIAALGKDPRRFYAKGTPAIRIPDRTVTTGVQQAIALKHQRPDRFRPATAESRHRSYPGVATVAGPPPSRQGVDLGPGRNRPDRQPHPNAHGAQHGNAGETRGLDQAPRRESQGPANIAGAIRTDRPDPTARHQMRAGTPGRPHLDPDSPRSSGRERRAMPPAPPRRQERGDRPRASTETATPRHDQGTRFAPEPERRSAAPPAMNSPIAPGRTPWARPNRSLAEESPRQPPPPAAASETRPAPFPARQNPWSRPGRSLAEESPRQPPPPAAVSGNGPVSFPARPHQSMANESPRQAPPRAATFTSRTGPRSREVSPATEAGGASPLPRQEFSRGSNAPSPHRGVFGGQGQRRGSEFRGGAGGHSGQNRP
jgi:hypothetical protein